MKIYILRHAVAETRRPNLSDRNRRLTPAGLQELNEVVRGLRRLKVQPDIILASSYRRAWDTAVVAARLLTPHKRPIEFDALKPSGSPTRIWLELKQYATQRSVMVVGHEPLLTELAAFLLNTPHLTINLKKSGFIRIDVSAVRANRPGGTLRWLLTSRHLARLA